MLNKQLNSLINRLQSDWSFVASFLNNRQVALAGYDLTKSERTALLATAPDALISLGVDRDMALGAMSGMHTPQCSGGCGRH